MKTENKIRFSLLFFIIIVFMALLTSCGGGAGDPTPTKSAQDEVKEKLTSSTWSIQTVTVDGVDQSSIYKNLSLKFAAASYTSTKGGAIWPASGTWSFADQAGTTIKKEDGTEVKVDAKDTSLKLTLTWTKTTLGSGRVESVKGLHVFTFGK